MGTTRRAIAVLVLAGMIVAAAPPALWADSAIPPGANIFGVNPNANGTKVSGQLAIYYQVISTTCGGGPLHLVNMYFVMRLKLGVDTFAFAPAAATTVCYEATTLQKDAIDGFITTVVIPALFQAPSPVPHCSNLITSTCWDLKSVTNFHQDGELQPTPPTAFWAVMDITLAVTQ